MSIATIYETKCKIDIGPGWCGSVVVCDCALLVRLERVGHQRIILRSAMSK